MNQNKLDSEEVFNDYIVDENSTGKNLECGMITKVEVKEINGNDNHIAIPTYNVVLTILTQEDDELKAYKKTFSNVTLNGRVRFQNFVQRFNLISTNQNGESELHLERLINQLCGITTVKTVRIKKIQEIEPAEFASEEDKEYYRDLFSDSMANADMNDVPDIITHYTIIPAFEPDEEFRDFVKYHACIDQLDCFIDSKIQDEITVRVGVYLFNGGTARKFNKYYNCINSSGKKAFDSFCKEFNIVDGNGRVLYQNIEGQFCVAELENKNHRLYVQNLEALNTVGEDAEKQYRDIISQMSIEYLST